MLLKILTLTVLTFLLPYTGTCATPHASHDGVPFEEESPEHGFAERVKRYVAKDYPGQDITIIFDYPEVLKKLPNPPTIVACKNMGQGRLQIIVKDMTDAIGAKVDILLRVPVLNKPMSSSHRIEANDITMMHVPLAALNGPYALRAEDLLGKQSRYKILPARVPLQTTDLMAPIVIKRDAHVRVVYRTGHLSLATEAKALKDGAIGQRITFEAGRKTKKIIEATIIDEHTAEIHVASL